MLQLEIESYKIVLLKKNENNRLIKQREKRPKKARKQQEQLAKAARKWPTINIKNGKFADSKRADEKLPRRQITTITNKNSEKFVYFFLACSIRINQSMHILGLIE